LVFEPETKKYKENQMKKTIIALSVLLCSQFAMAELSVPQLQNKLLSLKNFSGEYSVAPKLGGWSKPAEPMTIAFWPLPGSNMIQYTYLRSAVASAYETDDGSCSAGSPLPRKLEIQGYDASKGAYVGRIYITPCKGGRAGAEKPTPLVALVLTSSNQLIIKAVVGGSESDPWIGSYNLQQFNN
jgi:hypothetical protein